MSEGKEVAPCRSPLDNPYLRIWGAGASRKWSRLALRFFFCCHVILIYDIYFFVCIYGDQNIITLFGRIRRRQIILWQHYFVWQPFPDGLGHVTVPSAEHTVAEMAIFSVYLVNKAGGLIYQYDNYVPRAEAEKTFSYPLDLVLKIHDEKVIVSFGQRDGIRGNVEIHFHITGDGWRSAGFWPHILMHFIIKSLIFHCHWSWTNILSIDLPINDNKHRRNINERSAICHGPHWQPQITSNRSFSILLCNLSC